jgi:DHA1 family tetracycline resistance protein-like MFS transporter
MSEPSPSASPRRAAFIFIFITVLLDMLALGMIIPVLPGLVSGFVGGNTAKAAETIGLFGTVWALMQFIFSPVLGAASDRFGRRPIVLLSNFGLGFDYILMALAPSLGWLLVGRTLSGITAASISTASAYIADVTPPDQRAARFGMLGAAFGVGFVLGPALGGVLGSINPHLTFWVAAGLSLLNALYGLFVLPESLPPEKRAPFTWKKASPIGSLALLRSYPELTGLAVVGFLATLAHGVLPSVFVLYASYRYGWDEKMVGICLALTGVCSVIVQGGLVRPVVARFGERTTLLLGMAAGAAGLAIYGLAPTGALFWVGTPVMGLWGLANAASQGLMTRAVKPSEQGQLQGANSSLMGMASLVGPGLFTMTFSTFIQESSPWKLPGAPFLLASLLLAVAGVVGWRVTRHMPAHAPQAEQPAVSTMPGH